MLENSIARVADLLRHSRQAVAFTGAGISTPSGIPDFRSPHSGLWEKVDPVAVASIYGFRQNPQAFYNWIYPLAEIMLNAHPNPAHHALAQLERINSLHGIITQNIDMLHTRAGSKVIFELHGHLREATCVHCFRVFIAEPIIRQFLADRMVPRCPDCGGVIKPNVILYGEQLPFKQLLSAQEASRKADLMLVIGSSLEVAPASDLPILTLRGGGKLVIINLEPTHLDSQAEIVIQGNAADVLPSLIQRLEFVK